MRARTAFVTGAATGIGEALIEKLDREGWQCFAGYNRQPPDTLLASCSDRVREDGSTVPMRRNLRAGRIPGEQRIGPGGLADAQVLEHDVHPDLDPGLCAICVERTAGVAAQHANLAELGAADTSRIETARAGFIGVG